MRISTYQPVVYSQEVRDLRTRIDETVAKIDALPQEKLTLAAQVKTCARQERSAHIFAGCSALVGMAGAAIASQTPLGFVAVAAGAVGVLGAEWKAADYSNAGHHAEYRLERMPFEQYRQSDKLDFLSDWESMKRHDEWHDAQRLAVNFPGEGVWEPAQSCLSVS